MTSKHSREHSTSGGHQTSLKAGPASGSTGKQNAKASARASSTKTDNSTQSESAEQRDSWPTGEVMAPTLPKGGLAVLSENSWSDHFMVAARESREGMLLVGPDGTLLHANPAFEQAHGHTTDELRGRSTFYIEAPEPELDLGARIRQILAEPTEWIGQASLRDKNGTICFGRFSISPVRSAGGEAKGCLVVDRALESELEQSQRLGTVGRMAGGIAHDFNNVIQAILGYASFALEELVEGATARRDVEQLVEVTRRAAGLVRQLLIFARREAAHPEEIDLAETVSNLVKTLRRVIGEHISLNLELKNTPFRIQADPGQIEQLLVALCLNSRDAMPAGGRITVRLREATPEDIQNGRPARDHAQEFVELSVADTRGLAAQSVLMRESATSPQSPWLTEQAAGAELGLATVYRIAKRHNALVTQAPLAEGGATCRILFPMPRAEGKTESPPLPLPSPSGPLRILLAEDDESIRKIASRALEKAGFEVLVATDGTQAIELFEAHPEELSVVLLDMVMPKANGTAVLNRIRLTEPSLPIILTSGYNIETLVPGSVDANTILFAKPYSPKALVQRVIEVARTAHPKRAGRRIG